VVVSAENLIPGCFSDPGGTYSNDSIVRITMDIDRIDAVRIVDISFMFLFLQIYGDLFNLKQNIKIK
jgi:hypothetical protein